MQTVKLEKLRIKLRKTAKSTKAGIKPTDKLSTLIRAVIEDAKNLPSNIKLNMDTWHESDADNCSVCFGGTYLLLSEIDTNNLQSVNFFNSKYNRVAKALDAIRLGNLNEALLIWTKKENKFPWNFANEYLGPIHGIKKSKFFNDMLMIADMLDKYGY